MTTKDCTSIVEGLKVIYFSKVKLRAYLMGGFMSALDAPIQSMHPGAEGPFMGSTPFCSSLRTSLYLNNIPAERRQSMAIMFKPLVAPFGLRSVAVRGNSSA